MKTAYPAAESTAKTTPPSVGLPVIPSMYASNAIPVSHCSIEYIEKKEKKMMVGNDMMDILRPTKITATICNQNENKYNKILAKNKNRCKDTYPNANKLFMQNHPRQ